MSTRDHEIWQQLDESVIGVITSMLTTPFARAAGESRVVAAMEVARATAPVDRMRFIGIAVSVAAALHLGLIWTRGPIGWWSLILPSMALGFGVLATAVAMGAGRRR